ncbi:MAG: hypothetical protein ABII12_05220 [Planctomycetota bacterium]
MAELAGGARLAASSVPNGPKTDFWVSDIAESCCAPMGNHERKHTRSARGETRAALPQKIVRQQLGYRHEEWLAFMEMFPRCIELPEAILVHGMFEPHIPLEQQRNTAVIGTLTGEAHMSRHYAEPWYDTYDGRKPLVIGHHDYLKLGSEPLIIEGLVCGIDTGCCHGGRLTALILPEFRIVSTPARGDHWSCPSPERGKQDAGAPAAGSFCAPITRNVQPLRSKRTWETSLTSKSANCTVPAA